MKIPVRAAENKLRGRQFDMPGLDDENPHLFLSLG